MAVSGTSNERNYASLLGTAGTEQTENLAKKYGIEYTTEDSGNLGFEDYLKLMITQLTNQDFMNPTDDNEYMTQMTQYSTLQAMQELAKYSQNNYAMSMIGQTVSASKYSNGKMISETGTVEQIIRKDDEYQIMINGQSFTFKQILTVGKQSDATAGTTDTAASANSGTGNSQAAASANTNTTANTNAANNSNTEKTDKEKEEDLQKRSEAAMG